MIILNGVMSGNRFNGVSVSISLCPDQHLLHNKTLVDVQHHNFFMASPLIHQQLSLITAKLDNNVRGKLFLMFSGFSSSTVFNLMSFQMDRVL